MSGNKESPSMSAGRVIWNYSVGCERAGTDVCQSESVLSPAWDGGTRHVIGACHPIVLNTSKDCPGFLSLGPAGQRSIL